MYIQVFTCCPFAVANIATHITKINLTFLTSSILVCVELKNIKQKLIKCLSVISSCGHIWRSVLSTLSPSALRLVGLKERTENYCQFGLICRNATNDYISNLCGISVVQCNRGVASTRPSRTTEVVSFDMTLESILTVLSRSWR